MANIIKNEYDDCKLISIQKGNIYNLGGINYKYFLLNNNKIYYTDSKVHDTIFKEEFYSDEKYIQNNYGDIEKSYKIIITNYGKLFHLFRAAPKPGYGYVLSPGEGLPNLYIDYYYNINQYISKTLLNYLVGFCCDLTCYNHRYNKNLTKNELIQQFVDDFNKDTVCSVSKFIERGEIEQQNKEQFEEINKLKTEIINKDVNILELQNKVKSLEANLQSLKQNTEEQITGLKTKLLDNHQKFISIHTNDYLQIRKLKETLEFANFMDGLKDHKTDYLERVKKSVESENNLLSNKQIKQKSDDLIKLKLELDQFKKDLDIKHSLHITKTQELNKNKLELEQDKNNLETEYLNIKKWKKDLENLESKLNNKQTELKKHIKAFNKEKFNFKTKIIKKMGLIKDSDSDDNNSDNNTDDEY
ncbi:hypothetical protein crov190 [Cafeteria roenbergensis virus]|uniref:Uncharacterized protein n=1 Tax=Cafeteria roenbergensis virus (strain BV-PW1) TaxID=693272 RepID=E3T4W0_CROVB|nr:hypothetical protein crov190 [Cafeteria roenbergensis virus BV-PW1]ADO67223.1 hypothetical protein crov190 [Cafeteria roenbergensis virus BV-PW1]